MRPTVHVQGLGSVSLQRVAQIELCDEVGHLETFHLGAAVKAINTRRIKELSEKVLRKAAHTLVQKGLLENFGHGMYKWRAK